MNTVGKMRRTQYRVRKWLEERGYTVHIIQHTMWSKDIFGLFDGLIVKYKKVIFIQIKANRLPIIKDYETWNNLTGTPVVLFRVPDRHEIEYKIIGDIEFP